MLMEMTESYIRRDQAVICPLHKQSIPAALQTYKWEYKAKGSR